jgi:hypothetical protein
VIIEQYTQKEPLALFKAILSMVVFKKQTLPREKQHHKPEWRSWCAWETFPPHKIAERRWKTIREIEVKSKTTAKKNNTKTIVMLHEQYRSIEKYGRSSTPAVTKQKSVSTFSQTIFSIQLFEWFCTESILCIDFCFVFSLSARSYDEKSSARWCLWYFCRFS